MWRCRRMSEPVAWRMLSRRSSTGRTATSRLRSTTTELDDGNSPRPVSISENSYVVDHGFSAVVLSGRFPRRSSHEEAPEGGGGCNARLGVFALKYHYRCMHLSRADSIMQ
jgi:hypothetical protein